MKDKSGAVTALARIDMINSHLKLDWTYTPPTRFSPLDLLPAAKFLAALETGAGVAVFINGQHLGNQGPGGLHPSDTGEAGRHARFIEHLANVQMKTGAFFEVAATLTPEEEQAIVLASRLLNGEKIKETWKEVRLEVIPGGREPVERALSGPSQVARIGARLTLSIQGETIPIGMVIQELESARVGKWEETDDGSPPGTTSVTLVPGHTDAMTRFLDTDSD